MLNPGNFYLHILYMPSRWLNNEIIVRKLYCQFEVMQAYSILLWTVSY